MPVAAVFQPFRFLSSASQAGSRAAIGGGVLDSFQYRIQAVSQRVLRDWLFWFVPSYLRGWIFGFAWLYWSIEERCHGWVWARSGVSVSPDIPPQVSPWDCTGCELCVRICPADALKLADAAKVIEADFLVDCNHYACHRHEWAWKLMHYKKNYANILTQSQIVSIPLDFGLCRSNMLRTWCLEEEEANWNFAVTLPDRGDEIDKTTVKGSQFQKPYLEFSILLWRSKGILWKESSDLVTF